MLRSNNAGGGGGTAKPGKRTLSSSDAGKTVRRDAFARSYPARGFASVLGTTMPTAPSLLTAPTEASNSQSSSLSVSLPKDRSGGGDNITSLNPIAAATTQPCVVPSLADLCMAALRRRGRIDTIKGAIPIGAHLLVPLCARLQPEQLKKVAATNAATVYVEEWNPLWKRHAMALSEFEPAWLSSSQSPSLSSSSSSSSAPSFKSAAASSSSSSSSSSSNHRYRQLAQSGRWRLLYDALTDMRAMRRRHTDELIDVSRQAAAVQRSTASVCFLPPPSVRRDATGISKGNATTVLRRANSSSTGSGGVGGKKKATSALSKLRKQFKKQRR
jgi:hypothetical protein